MRWLIFALICIVVFGAVILTNRGGQGASFKGDATKIITQGPIADHVFGSTAGKVVFIEYGDFQCPACGAVYPTVSAIKNAYKDNLTFIFRNFPLTSLHPNALAAATAAEAAGRQGKYYEMFDQLYQHQNDWSDLDAGKRDALFMQYAQAIGVDMKKFDNDLSSSAVADKIHRDQDTGNGFNVNGTPTFVLNGKVLSSDIGTNPSNLQKAVQSALTKAGFSVDN